MKKVLSALLAMLMVVSCMAGITFSVAAEGTETIALYKGETTKSEFGGQSATGNTIGQVLTIPAGKALVSIAYPITYTYVGGTKPGTINVWQWNGAKGALLYTGDFSFKDNATDSVITINNPEIANITGTIYYEIAYNDPSLRIAVGGSTQGPADGVTNYYNGVAGNYTNHWGCSASSYGIGSTITVQDTVEITSMKLAGEAATTQYNWKLAATEIGQRFTVPGGNVLTKYTIGQLHDYKGKGNTGRLDIYQWNNNYAISTAADPLFSMDIKDYNGEALEAVIPADKKIGGEVIAVITYLSGNGAGWKPQGGTEAVAGVYHYADGYAYSGSANAKGIYSWINWEEGEAVTNAPKYNKVPLYTGASNTGGQFTNSSLSGAAKQTFGQKFTLDGEVLAGISFDMLRTNPNDGAVNKGTLKVFVWDTDYATTVASAPKYSVEFANHRNDNAKAFAIPTELGLTGTLYYEVEYLEGTSNHGYFPGTGATKEGVESFRNGAAITGVWTGEKNIGCDVFTLDMEETSYPLYVTASTSQYTGNANHTAVIGQTAIIPAGKVLSGLDLGTMRSSTYAWGSTITGIFNVYQWAGSYAETVSRTPLYTDANISVKHDQALKIEIPASLMIEGNILWTLTPTTAGITFNPDAAKDQIAGTDSYTDGVATKGPWTGGEYIKSSLLLVDGGIYGAETPSITYINSIDKTVLYSGNVAFGNMPSATKTAFRAAANQYANGTWGAWDGTFYHAGNGVYYTNHTYADTVTVDGVATALNGKNYLTVEANPVGFVGWKDNTGAFVSSSAAMKWFPKSADATLTAVYEGEFAPTVSATATIKNDLLTVVVTPTLNSSVSEYGYYISTTGPIDTQALEGVTKVTANDAFAAYLQRVYNLKPATTNVYVLPYIVVNGNVVYGTPVSVAR